MSLTKLATQVLVAGAGCSGICAAIAAARHGAQVILLNDRSVPGGNASSEVGVGISGAAHSGGLGVSMNPGIYVKESGIIDELRQRALFYNQGGGYGPYALWDAVFFDALYGEKNLTLMQNTSLDSCVTQDGLIRQIHARNLNSNDEYEITAQVYIDATGHAILAKAAGADYTVGRESRDQYGETWAPEQADRRTMGNTFLFHTEDVGHPVTFHAPEFAYDITKLDLLEREGFTNPRCFRALSSRGADWTYEYGGQVDTIHDTELIDLELRKLTFGIWDYVKNSGKYPDAANRVLRSVNGRAGTRESRRVLGDYVLTETDVENKTDFPDSIGHGGWPMDIHAPKGIFDQLPASNFIPVTGPYNMPYRCLYSRNIRNLMTAGRDVSVTHIALGSTRVMATCAVLGQAAGTAAALCAQYAELPRDILHRMPQLQQQLLDDDQTIYFRQDSGMCGFTAHADSEMPHAFTDEDGALALTRDYGLALMLDPGRLDTLEIRVRNPSDAAHSLRYRLLTGEHPETFLPCRDVGSRETLVPGGFDGWLKLSPRADAGPDGKLYLIFLREPALSLGCGSARHLGSLTMLMHTEACHAGMDHDSVPLGAATGYIAFDHYALHRTSLLFRSLAPAQQLYAARQAINGWPRPFGGMNLWRPSGALPQTLTLTAPTPVDAARIAVTFDDALEYDCHRQMPPCLVKSYVLQLETAHGPITLRDEQNWRRYAVHTIRAEGITSIRLTLLETYGGVPGVFSVKLLSA